MRQSREFSSHKTWSRGGVTPARRTRGGPPRRRARARCVAAEAHGCWRRVSRRSRRGSQLFSRSTRNQRRRSPASRRTMARDTAPLASRSSPRIKVARHAAHQKNSRSGFRRGRRPLPKPPHQKTGVLLYVVLPSLTGLSLDAASSEGAGSLSHACLKDFPSPPLLYRAPSPHDSSAIPVRVAAAAL